MTASKHTSGVTTNLAPFAAWRGAALVVLLLAGVWGCPSERRVPPSRTEPAPSARTDRSVATDAGSREASSTATGPIPFEDAGTTGPVLDLAGAVWSPDRRRLATIIEYRVHLWDGATKAHLRELEASSCEEVLFSPNGETLFVGHVNAPPSAFDLTRDASTERSFELPKGIHPEVDRGAGMLSISQNGLWLLGRCDTMEICLWSTKTFAGRRWERPETRASASELVSLKFAKSDTRIVAKREDGTSHDIDAATLRPPR